MAQRYDIVMLALPRWDGSYSSTAYSLAKEFSKANRVFYIDNPFTVKDFIADFASPQIQSRKKALLTGKNSYRKIINENLTVVTPRLTLPINFLSEGNLYDKLSAYNDTIVFRVMEKLVRDYDIKNFIFINSFNPFYFRKFPDFFKPALYIYHTVDDISQSKYIKKHGVRLENEAIRKADLTLTTSQELKRLKSDISDRIFHLPNAADVSLFAAPRNGESSMPDDIKGITKPIVIYTGHIDYRLDYDLLKYIIKANPDKHFLMVGPVSIDKLLCEELKAFSNVSFTGKKDISELPDYLQWSKGAIIPFQCNQLTKSIYPLKVNEYLAAGRPVVSTAFSKDIVDFENVITVARDYESFSAALNTAVNSNTPEEISRRQKIVANNTWEARVTLFWEIVGKYLPPVPVS